jgi:2-dehydro-3-deoxygluconokinase
MRLDVVAIGEPMIEFNQTKPREPHYRQGFGGDTSNAAIAAARQGARAGYVTRLGEDEFGRLFLELWRKERVDMRGVALDARAHTAVYFVRHGAKGHVFSYLRAGSAASRMRPRDLPMSVIRNARFVHASGISMAISQSACESVLFAFRNTRAKISFDSNLRLKLWPLGKARTEMAKAIALADYFFPSLEDAEALSGLKDADAILDWARALGARTIFLKLGGKGVLVFHENVKTRIKGIRVRSVDATGAGDCFAGAALARLAAGDSPVEAARYANAAAALKTTGFGAVAPIPRPAAVRALLGRG